MGTQSFFFILLSAQWSLCALSTSRDNFEAPTEKKTPFPLRLPLPRPPPARAASLWFYLAPPPTFTCCSSPASFFPPIMPLFENKVPRDRRPAASPSAIWRLPGATVGPARAGGDPALWPPPRPKGRLTLRKRKPGPRASMWPWSAAPFAIAPAAA